MSQSKIVWTKVDEAPALATYALLPVVKAYTNGTGIAVEEADISLAGRIIAAFPERLTDVQRLPDYLSELGKLVKKPGANIVKLPNISASIPQLQAALEELRQKGYDLPDYPGEPKSDEERALKERFGGVLGSAVNPVLREGNSDRRPAASVKRFARKNPHKMMKPWPESGSKSRVVHMQANDFFGSEKSVACDAARSVKIVFRGADHGATLKDFFALEAGEVIDAAVMSVAALRAFFKEQLQTAKEEGLLFSLHLKATMMKISDPIMFGHCVQVFFDTLFERYGEALSAAGVDPRNGFADVLSKLDRLPEGTRREIEAEIRAAYDAGPDLAMVDSGRGITNLHLPNNVIIDASMPTVVRDGGRMWNKEGALQETLAVIPDRSYATIYQEIIEDCQRNGQFDPAEMGSVSNVGLMAKKAEEYGSHDKTFEAHGDGVIEVVDERGEVLLSQQVATGDIFRMCQTKDGPIRDWVRLAVDRARAAGVPAVFWLDDARGHDAVLIRKVSHDLALLDTEGLDIRILSPVEAMRFTLARTRRGEDTIAVTGNVLRDYLTDLFPILELGTSARLLSIVPLMNGGGLFETGAGGSAPKHVQQFLREGHLRWDSLGEYCALVPSLELIARSDGNEKAALLAEALDRAIAAYLENDRSPARKVNEPDNRTATFYLALYWARELAVQDRDAGLERRFGPVARELSRQEGTIVAELLAAQGRAVDIGGYYRPDDTVAEREMRPSATFNAIIEPLL